MFCRKTSIILSLLLISVFACQKSDPSADIFYTSLLTNDTNQLKKYLDGHDPEKLVLLPTEMILDLDHSLIKDSILWQFVEIKKAQYYLNDQEAEQSLKCLLPVLSKEQYPLLHFEAKSLNAYYNPESAEDVFFNSLNKLPATNSIYALYKYSVFLEIISQYHSENERNFQALSTIEYALHLIHQSEFKNDLQLRQAVFLTRKAEILLNEYHDYEQHQKISGALLEEVIGIYEGLKLENHSFSIKVKAVNSLLESESDKKIDSMILVLDSLVVNVDPNNQSWYYRIMGIHYFHNEQTDKAITLWNRSNQVLSNAVCSEDYLINQLYLIHAYDALGNIDSMNHYYTEMLGLKSCSDHLNTLIDFYAADVISMINYRKYEDRKQTVNLDTFLNPLLSKRQAALVIFDSKDEFHLGDFYAQNTAEIMDLFLSRYTDKPMSEKYTDVALSLFYDTKARELKRKSNQQNLSDTLDLANKVDIAIQKCLHEIDDFKVCGDFGNPVYKTLFDLYNQKFSLEIADDSKEEDKVSFSARDIQRKLLDKSLILHEFFLYGDSYYGIRLDGSQGRVYRFNKSKLDTLLSDYRTAILNKENTNGFSFALKEMLFPFENDLKDNLLIIPDGNVSFVPISDFFPNQRVQFHYDLDKWSHEVRLSLDRSSVGIISFSDPATIVNKALRKYTELPNGYGECVFLSEYFKESDLYAGKNCTKQNLTKVLDKSIVHLSTHGFVNSAKRQDCYLLVRNNDDFEKVYSNDILSINSSPEFVFLSACDTGLGQFMSAEGIYSISRSFFQNGSTTVIKTLWKISDQTTEIFTRYFYQEWDRGLSAQEALFIAQQKMKTAGYANPYYWAGFVLEGNGELYLSNYNR